MAEEDAGNRSLERAIAFDESNQKRLFQALSQPSKQPLRPHPADTGPEGHHIKPARQRGIIRTRLMLLACPLSSVAPNVIIFAHGSAATT